jgi:hypothetical protein
MQFSVTEKQLPHVHDGIEGEYGIALHILRHHTRWR